MKNIPDQATTLEIQAPAKSEQSTEHLVIETMQRLATLNPAADQSTLAKWAAIELAAELLRIRREHAAILEQAHQNLERLNQLAHRRADLLHLTDSWLKDREAFPGEKRLRHVVRDTDGADGPDADPFHHN